MKTSSIVCRARAAIQRHFAAPNRGQALVEFAFIAPVFLLLLVAAVDFGRVFFTYIQLNNTAREAAAYAAFNPGAGDATFTTIAMRETNVQAQRGETTLSAAATCVNNLGTPLVSCSLAQGGAGAGNRITVSVGERFTFFTPLIGNFWPGGLRLGASATAAVVDFAAGGASGGGSCSTLPPMPTFTWQSPDPVNRPFLISVNAGASTSLASPCQNVGYNWDFGGASTDPGSDYLREGVTQDYEYAAGGAYTVTLVVSNAAGDSTPFSQTITVGGTSCRAPTAGFTVTPAAITNGSGQITNWNAANNGGQQGTQFTFDGRNMSSYMSDPACHPVWSWDLGDGTFPMPSTSVVSHTYANAWKNKTVQVRLKVTNDAGTNTSAPFGIPLR